MLHTRPLSRSVPFGPRLLRPLLAVLVLVTVTVGARTPAADPPPDSPDDFPSVLAQDMERVFFLPGRIRIAEERSVQRQDDLTAAGNDEEKKKRINEDYDTLDKLIKAKKEDLTKSAKRIDSLKDQLAKADPSARVPMVNLIGFQLEKLHPGAFDTVLKKNMDEVIAFLQFPKPGEVEVGLTPEKYLAQLQPIVQSLVEFTKPGRDSTVELRVAATLALGKVNGDAREVSPVLAGLLRDQENPVALRLAATEALGRPVTLLLQTATPNSKLSTEQQLELILIDSGHLVWPALMDGLHDPSARVRLACAKAAKDQSGVFFDRAQLVGAQEQIKDLPSLVARYRDLLKKFNGLLKAFSEKKKELATALADRDPAITRLVLSVIEDLAVVYLRITNTLAQLPPPPPALPPEADFLPDVLKEARPYLVKVFHSPDLQIRREAGYALEDLGSGAIDVLPDLTAGLSDPDRFIRWTMLRTLGRLAPKEAKVVVPAVIPLVADSDIDVRTAALKALDRYGKDAAGMGAGPAIAKLLLQDDSPTVLAGLKALQAIGDWDGPTLEVVAELLKNAEVSVRVGAAQALGRAGAKAAAFRPALEFALTDSDEKVRIAASEALLRIKK